jgi:apolipoprotein N-acyltransferase
VKPKALRAEHVALLSGAVLGLSAPGFDQWYLAWCGLAPFFLVIDWSKSLSGAAFRGWLFGLAYQLVWLSWFLKLNPPQWVGVQSAQQLLLLAVVVWIGAALINGSTFALAALIMRAFMNKGWLKLAGGDRGWLPSILLIPLLWVAVFGLFANQPDLLLLPMASLEYSQYKNVSLLQLCCLVGGVGLQFLIVAHNVALAVVAASMARPSGGRRLLLEKTRSAWGQWLAVACLIGGAALYGGYVARSVVLQPDQNVTVLQPGLMLETDRKRRGLQVAEALALALPMIEQCPVGLVVWTEQSVPMLFDAASPALEPLKHVAADRHLDLIFGVEEPAGAAGKKYNAAAGIASTGEFAPTLYRKRYLIPFGEFEPLVLRAIPVSIKEKLKLPQSPPLLASAEDNVLKLSRGDAALLICGENVDASLCARSVRKGGQVIANISNLTWFQNSILGAQTMAAAVIRAVENRRYYIYAADTGPSFVVDPYGRVVTRTRWGEVSALSTRFSYLKDLTPFCRLHAW